ncbi:hypothetical protein ACLKA7_002383 [Drosophila subpalustris]
MSTHFGSKDGILIRIMKLEDYESLKVFMGGNFYNGEPLCAYSGEDVQQCFPSDLETHRKEADEMEKHSWARIAVFLSEVERKVNIFERYGASKLLYSHMTNVDASMRGKGLGTRLAAALMELGRSKGFPFCGFCGSSGVQATSTTHTYSSIGYQTIGS